MDTETNSTEQASVSGLDQMAELLGGTEDANNSEERENTEGSEDNGSEQEGKTSEDIETEDKETEGNEEPEGEELSGETWSDVLGIEEDKLVFNEEGNLEGVVVKVDGETSKLPLSEVVKGYQSAKSYTQKSQQLAEERKQFEASQQQLASEYQQKLENAEQLSKLLENKLVTDFQGINWEQLRVENPAEYAALKQDYASQASELQQVQQAILQERQQQQQKLQEQQKKQFGENLKQQFHIMLENNPEWKDAEKRNQAMSNFKEFMTNRYGFTSADFDNVTDARLIEVIKDAKAYNDGKKIVAKKLKPKLPKFQKSGGRTKKRVSKVDALIKKAKAAKGANKRHAQVDAIANLLL